MILALAGIAAATGDATRAARLAGATELYELLFLEATFHEIDVESAKAASDPETWVGSSRLPVGSRYGRDV